MPSVLRGNERDREEAQGPEEKPVGKGIGRQDPEPQCPPEFCPPERAVPEKDKACDDGHDVQENLDLPAPEPVFGLAEGKDEQRENGHHPGETGIPQSPGCLMELMPEEREDGCRQDDDDGQFPDDIIAAGVGQPEHDQPRKEQPMLIVLVPEILPGDSLFVRLPEKGDKIPLVPEGDIDVILGDIDDQDEKGDQSQDQADKTEKPAGFYQSATRQNDMSRREDKSR